ncbi:hypothetical protein SDC9_34397 [bioreactor metagenome]|uniref:Uncharacterized protein n=1 Tax=bioreactor metagenome TaxID=1076179 RepID=A0A644VAY6_9ZZZZ
MLDAGKRERHLHHLDEGAGLERAQVLLAQLTAERAAADDAGDALLHGEIGRRELARRHHLAARSKDCLGLFDAAGGDPLGRKRLVAVDHRERSLHRRADPVTRMHHHLRRRRIEETKRHRLARRARRARLGQRGKGLRRAKPRGQPGAAAPARQDAERVFGQADLRLEMHDAGRAMQCQLAAAAERDPLHRRDRGHRRLAQQRVKRMAAGDEAADRVPVRAFDHLDETGEVGAGREGARVVVADHQRLHRAADLAQRLLDHVEDAVVDRVHLGGEFETADAVAQIPQAGRGIAGKLRACRLRPVERVMRRGVLHHRGHRRQAQRGAAGGVEALGDGEGALAPGKAELERRIKRGGAGRDLGDMGRGIAQHLAQHLARIGAKLALIGEQRRQILAAAGHGDGLHRAVFAGRRVDHLAAAVGGLAVETRARLAAEAALGDHVPDQRICRQVEAVDRVVGGQLAHQRAPDARDHVDADQIRQAEDAGARDAEDGLHGVGLLDRQTKAQRLDHGDRHPGAADAVGDEAGGVAAVDHRLAQHRAPGLADEGLRRPAVLGDQLEQRHVPRRVEEMRDREARRERGAEALGQQFAQDRRGVRRHHRAGRQERRDLGEERALDLEVFDHRLDDPVGLGDAGDVILDVAGAHERGGAGAGETARLQLRGDAGLGAGVAVALGRDVEQVDRNAGVGELRGDARAHRARPDHHGAAASARRHAPGLRQFRHLRAFLVMPRGAVGTGRGPLRSSVSGPGDGPAAPCAAQPSACGRRPAAGPEIR